MAEKNDGTIVIALEQLSFRGEEPARLTYPKEMEEQDWCDMLDWLELICHKLKRKTGRGYKVGICEPADHPLGAQEIDRLLGNSEP